MIFCGVFSVKQKQLDVKTSSCLDLRSRRDQGLRCVTTWALSKLDNSSFVESVLNKSSALCGYVLMSLLLDTPNQTNCAASIFHSGIMAHVLARSMICPNAYEMDEMNEALQKPTCRGL
jgi:hypothetical protein